MDAGVKMMSVQFSIGAQRSPVQCTSAARQGGELGWLGWLTVWVTDRATFQSAASVGRCLPDVVLFFVVDASIVRDALGNQPYETKDG